MMCQCLVPATLSPLTCECPHSESTEPCEVHRELAIDRLPRFLIPPQRICRNCKNKDGGCVAQSVFQLRGQTQTGPRLCFLFPHDMETNIFLMSLLCEEREVLLGANTKGRSQVTVPGHGGAVWFVSALCWLRLHTAPLFYYILFPTPDEVDYRSVWPLQHI